ncbi:hypothetical protein [Sneathiella sp. HT1-7]|uniref:hypothetical protein n=1 Tax=Sneathiella sp. HT1-7 TaxID=2887192 RepID=UPI001D13BDA8|nr:hypothetical protein [Sneathiella sp. HT1-7]MCC3305106.1 hypothetical protein [Sneathiella sp. HT1-7]
MAYFMSRDQLQNLTIRQLTALFATARQAVISTSPCTAEHAKTVAAIRQIAQIIAFKDAQMRAFIPAPRCIIAPHPGL